MVRQCPLLEKFYIPSEGELKDWQKWVESDCCPLQDLCIFDIEGKVPPVLIEKLEEAMIPCPKCQKDAIYAEEVKTGKRISGLTKNKDGDWSCWLCGFVIYSPPLKKTIIKVV